MSRQAALDARAWWLETGAGAAGRARRSVVRTLGELAEVAALAGIDTLHVHASALAGLELPAEIEPPLPGQRRPPHTFMRAEGWSVSAAALTPWVELERDGRRLAIGFGAYQGNGDPFGDAADGRELLLAHLAYADALAERGRPWYFQHSAMLTGWKLMHAPWERGGRRRTRPLDGPTNVQPELADQPAGTQVEVPYGGAWARQNAGAGPELGYVAAFDVNAQRLAACSRLALGVGGLEHRPGGDAELKLPGYHRVAVVGVPHAGEIPPIFTPGWHTTPRVAMARYLGLELELTESWVWTDQVPYLDPFYTRMRAAREQLLERDDRPAAIALAALKRTYLEPFGRLRSGKLRDARDVRYRPSWYDAIIGQELAREYLRLHKLTDAGERVLAVYFDTIIMEVPSADYVPAELEVSTQLGKYKRAGLMRAGDALDALYLEDGSYDVGALVSALKHAGRAASPDPPVPLADAAPACPSARHRPVHGGWPA